MLFPREPWGLQGVRLGTKSWNTPFCRPFNGLFLQFNYRDQSFLRLVSQRRRRGHARGDPGHVSSDTLCSVASVVDKFASVCNGSVTEKRKAFFL